jgi:hypothetical protein
MQTLESTIQSIKTMFESTQIDFVELRSQNIDQAFLIPIQICAW